MPACSRVLPLLVPLVEAPCPLVEAACCCVEAACCCALVRCCHASTDATYTLFYCSFFVFAYYSFFLQGLGMERVAAVEILSSVGVVIDGLEAAGYALLHLHPANIIIQVAARLRSHASSPTPPLPRLLSHASSPTPLLLFCHLPTPAAYACILDIHILHHH